MDATKGQEAINYLDERLIQPLLMAKAVIANAHEIESTARIRADQADKLQAEIQELQKKKQDMEAGLTALKDNITKQRLDLHEQLQQDRKIRQKYLDDHAREKSGLHDQLNEERAKVEDIKRGRLQADQELAAMKNMITQKLETLQEMAK